MNEYIYKNIFYFQFRAVMNVSKRQLEESENSKSHPFKNYDHCKNYKSKKINNRKLIDKIFKKKKN